MSSAALHAGARAVGELSDLPDPVYRYLKHVLAGDQRAIRAMRMSQRGELRTDHHRDRWMHFRAEHVAMPLSKSFRWDAKVRILPHLHVRVTDAYEEGVGSGQARLLSSITIATDTNKPELNSASLHRYLAEAVWYPTALLPSAGVQWSPIDNRRALATLTDSGITVSLEFRFNDADEVVGIYAHARWSRSGKTYRPLPWEGHFSDYRLHQGMLVPFRGEVGWYADGRLEIVWRGEITSLDYEFGQVQR